MKYSIKKKRRNQKSVQPQWKNAHFQGFICISIVVFAMDIAFQLKANQLIQISQLQTEHHFTLPPTPPGACARRPSSLSSLNPENSKCNSCLILLDTTTIQVADKIVTKIKPFDQSSWPVVSLHDVFSTGSIVCFRVKNS